MSIRGVFSCAAIAIAGCAAAKVPAAVFDPGALAMVGRHTRVAHHGRASFRSDGGAFDQQRPFPDEPAERAVLEVIGETRDRVRVVAVTDEAQLALWIDRADLAPTIVAPIELVGAADAGVWLDAGADVEVGPPAAGRRAATLRSAVVRASGSVRADSLGTIWVDSAPPARRAASSGLEPSPIRAAASPDAPVIAESIALAAVAVIATRDDWTEIELSLPRARIRGFVPSARLGAPPPPPPPPVPTALAWMTDTELYLVARGTCLYDPDRRAVIGVTTGDKKRFGWPDSPAGWHELFVETPWDQQRVLMRVGRRDDDDDPVGLPCAH